MNFDFAAGSRDVFYVDAAFDKKDIEAVVLDLDGTVVDSVDQIVHCAKSAFKLLNLPEPETNAIKSIIGKKLEEGLTFLLPDDKKSMGSEVTTWYRQFFIDNDKYNKQVLFDGVVDTLDYLATKGYKLAVASGRSTIGIQRALDTTILGKYIQVFCAGDEVPSKPHPKMALTVAKRLGVSPNCMLGVGDTDMDIELFLNAKAKSAGVCTGVWSGDAIKTLKPHLVLPHIGFLKDVL